MTLTAPATSALQHTVTPAIVGVIKAFLSEQARPHRPSEEAFHIDPTPTVHHPEEDRRLSPCMFPRTSRRLSASALQVLARTFPPLENVTQHDSDEEEFLRRAHLSVVDGPRKMSLSRHLRITH
jgi:hypothetical protein